MGRKRIVSFRVPPAGKIGTFWRTFMDALQNFVDVHGIVPQAGQVVGVLRIPIPAVLRPISVVHLTIVVGVGGALQKFLHEIHCIV